MKYFAELIKEGLVLYQIKDVWRSSRERLIYFTVEKVLSDPRKDFAKGDKTYTDTGSKTYFADEPKLVKAIFTNKFSTGENF